MDVKEIAELDFKSSMIFCADPVTGNQLASGDNKETVRWLNGYGVELAQVIPFIPDRAPDAIGPDGFIHWWQLENGVILGRFGKDPYGGGYIIPPDAEGPPLIRDFVWLDHSRSLNLVPSLDPIDGQPE